MSAVSNIRKTVDFSELIIKSSPAIAAKFFHQAIDFFCGQKTPDYKDYEKIWTLFEWWDILESSQEFLKTYKTSEVNTSNFLSKLPNEFRNVISDCLETRSEDLQEALLQKTHQVAPAYLKDYDWQLKLTLASDKMAQINEPRLAVDFDIQEGNQSKLLSLDMSKEEVKKLIDVLEAATKEVPTLML